MLLSRTKYNYTLFTLTTCTNKIQWRSKNKVFTNSDDKCSHQVPQRDTPRVMSAKNHRSEPSLYHQLLYVPITIAGVLTTYEDTLRVHPNDVQNSTMTTVYCGPQTRTHTHTLKCSTMVL